MIIAKNKNITIELEKIANIEHVSLSIIFLLHLESSEFDFCNENNDQNIKSVQFISDSDLLLTNQRQKRRSQRNPQFDLDF